MRLVVNGNPVEFVDGDDVLTAVIRNDTIPRGTLCGAGDCPNCLATIDGVAYTRMCRTVARPGMTVEPHTASEYPSLPDSPLNRHTPSRLLEADAVVVGGGETGAAAADRLRSEGKDVIRFEEMAGEAVAGVYAGPEVLIRTPAGIVRCETQEVVVATGSTEIHPVCPGNDLAGIFTRDAATRLHAAGVDLGTVVAIGEPPEGVECTKLEGELVRIEGTRRVDSVVVRGIDGVESLHPADSLSVGLGRMPRDVLARMGSGLPVTTAGGAGRPDELPPPPVAGVVCPCSDVAVSDLESVWDRGFRELELIKRATLAGTGTCQGAVCIPHVRSFMAERGAPTTSSFTARPLARQLTMAEASAGYSLPAFRRTALHEVHVALGARMDRFGGWWRPWRYGDVAREYWAVREGVSLGDVGTLGTYIVSGPDVVEFLERLYPTRIADLEPGRSRYVLNLAESGAVLDDGMVCRVDDARFILTFTSGGASFAEAWMRDWASTWGTRVHILDRTHAWGAINVTGPLARELLRRAGVTDAPRFMRHALAEVAGIECRVFRLSFTGEVSFELHHPADRSVELWTALMALGADLDIAPHGIDTLFTLRLEKGHILVGMDTEADSTPSRLRMEWAVRLDKPDFIGRQALIRAADRPADKRLLGMTMNGDAPDEGAIIRSGSDYVGYVTSSRFSPSLGFTVMLGWVRLRDGELPASLVVDDRAAVISETPFFDPEGSRARA